MLDLLFVVIIGINLSKDVWIALLKLLHDFSAIWLFHKLWLKGFDFVKNFIFQSFITDDSKRLLKNKISKHVEDEARDNEVDSSLQVLWFLGLEA